MATVTRRGLIAGSAGLAAVAAVGGVGLARFDKVETCRATLARLVGPFDMAPEAFDAFVRDFLKVDETLTGLRGGLMRAGEFTGLLARLGGLLPDASADEIERFERALLTNFVLTTNYLAVENPRREPIDYVGPLDACANPFARFD